MGARPPRALDPGHAARTPSRFSGTPSQAGILPAALVLTIMIVPITSAICRELFIRVPQELTDGALALGSTRWEAIRGVVFTYAAPGIAAAVLLGLGRAFGEAIAVNQTIGNQNSIRPRGSTPATPSGARSHPSTRARHEPAAGFVDSLSRGDPDGDLARGQHHRAVHRRSVRARQEGSVSEFPSIPSTSPSSRTDCDAAESSRRSSVSSRSPPRCSPAGFS